MCVTLTIVAYDSACRTIAQCEHGTIHLTWDITTLRFREQDFLSLVQFMAEKGTSEAPAVSEGWCLLECDARKTRRLWIGQVGLIATADDFALLAALVAEAGSALAIVKAPSSVLLDFPLLTVDTAAFGVN